MKTQAKSSATLAGELRQGGGMPKKQAAAAPAEPAPSGSHAESPEEAMKEFGLCLQRSLDLCQSVSKEIEKNVLDVDTVVSSDAKFKQRLARFL